MITIRGWSDHVPLPPGQFAGMSVSFMFPSPSRVTVQREGHAHSFGHRRKAHDRVPISLRARLRFSRGVLEIELVRQRSVS
jgi:hypothetical protein